MPSNRRRFLYDAAAGLWLSAKASGFQSAGAPALRIQIVDSATKKPMAARVRLLDPDIAIEGSFELPQLSRLSLEDQVFVTAFVRCHGSIKEMERVFGVSYPTVKARLNRIADSLDFVESDPTPSRVEVLDRLTRGEITTQDAIQQLEALR